LEMKNASRVYGRPAGQRDENIGDNVAQRGDSTRR